MKISKILKWMTSVRNYWDENTNMNWMRMITWNGNRMRRL